MSANKESLGGYLGTLLYSTVAAWLFWNWMFR